MLKKLWQKIFVQTYLDAEAASMRQYDAGEQRRVLFKSLVIFVYAPLALSINYYFGSSSMLTGTLHHLGLNGLADSFAEMIFKSSNPELSRLIWWVSVLIVTYFLFPVLIIRFLFREKLADYGLKFSGALRDYHLYVFMLMVMIPLVLYFSGTKSFQERYPFYDPEPGEKLWPGFWIWELFYFMQFAALEFFFRGFMTLGLQRRFGYYSIFVMTIPYCMIHFGKPFPETISAIIAGLVLGTLSMKSRSVFLGVMIHYSVAITMDLCALWREGFF